MIINDPVSEFNWAYEGYQYPLPKSWKYAIRQQDQINWLMQGLMALNAQGASVSELADAIAKVRAELLAEMEQLQRELEADIAAAIVGGSVHNPLNGCNVPAYVNAKQNYDALRVQASTFKELAHKGITYADVAAMGHTYLELDMFGNDYIGDGTARAKYTPVEHVETNTPGYGTEEKA